MKWFVIYTKPQFEIKVEQTLQNIGIRAYCPVYKQIKQYSDRKKKVLKPLLRSYVLVNINDKDRDKVFSVPGVVRYLFWLGKPAIVREEEIELMEIDAPGPTKRAPSEILARGTKRITKKLTITALLLKVKKSLMLKPSNLVSTISLLLKLPTFI